MDSKIGPHAYALSKSIPIQEIMKNFLPSGMFVTIMNAMKTELVEANMSRFLFRTITIDHILI